MKTRVLIGLTLFLCAATPSSNQVLPNGWLLPRVADVTATVGTFPQGLALSPDGSRVAVIEAGYNPPALRILNANTLVTQRVIPLTGAFGRPVWLNDAIVLVPGANRNAVLRVDSASGKVTPFGTGGHTWPVAIDLRNDAHFLATANDGNGSISLLPIPLTNAPPVVIRVGAHPADLRFSPRGNRLFVAVRGENTLAVLDLRTRTMRRLPIAGHPCALATTAREILVVACDASNLSRFSLTTLKPIASTHIDLARDGITAAEPIPNAIAIGPLGSIYISLAGRNAIARIGRNGSLSFIPAGWYPTGVAASATRLFVSDGKGEHAPPANPEFSPFTDNYKGYTASSLPGAVQSIDLALAHSHRDANTLSVFSAYAHLVRDLVVPKETPLRAHGPIHHVLYVIKENRSYDQVLGDLRPGDGDASLAYFGERVTPNQHAIEQQFGTFDRFYVDSRVSADGHNWTDAAISNDYVERFWPANYANRRKTYDFQDANAPDVPANGYLWDAAARAHITYRDYGENVDPRTPYGMVSVKFPALRGHIDPDYVGWDLSYSDLKREAEWQREFSSDVTNGSLPQLEIIYLPNDHTMGTKAGALSPQSYVATNDQAVGRLIEAVSHSRYWKSTAIFIVEDDAQNGPDHVSDQRSTLYVASAFARDGIHHAHYDQASVLHSIEIILGLQPLTMQDRVAVPLYAAFAATPNAAPFTLLPSEISLTEKNTTITPGAKQSARMDWSRPDAVDPRLLNAILAKLSRLQK